MTSAEQRGTTSAGNAIPSDPASLHDAASPEAVEIILSAEHLVTGAEWVLSGRVRMHRRVVSQTRTVEIVVCREELVVETLDVEHVGGERYRGTALDGPPVPGPDNSSGDPLVILLREQIPDVVMRSRVYERVTARVDTVTETVPWRDNMRHEQISTDEAAPAD